MIQKIAWSILLVFYGIGLSSCDFAGKIRQLSDSESTIKEKEDTTEKPSEIGILLGYFRYLDRLSGDELALERRNTQRAVLEFDDPIHRLRLAMLLSLPQHSETKDYDQALELLTNYLNDTAPLEPMLRDFSLFLSASILHFKNQEERYRDLDKTLRIQEEAYRNLDKMLKKQEEQYRSLARKLKIEETRSGKLQKMIEELKTIEKNIMKRDEN